MHTNAREHSDDLSIEQQLYEAAVHLGWHLRRGTREQLIPYDITVGQLRVLSAIHKHAPVKMSDLATDLEVVPRSMTTHVDVLEHAGLVRRQADAHDRRAVLVSVTAEGETLLTSVQSVRMDTAITLFGSLNPTEQGELLALLNKLHNHPLPRETHEEQEQ